ncbi:MAG: response regulator transcription factor [Aliarcobacter sp.]|nr:response regulator transcription factor [Aliarcobacter sp.]
MKILYLEDDYDLSETIEEFLEEEGFIVTSVYNSDSALKQLFHNSFDLLILDVQVPGIDGFELLKELREADILTPAIFTTSRNSIEDLSTGYEVGADDYLKKPFELQELLFRIKALLKREYKVQNETIQIDTHITFNYNLQTLITHEKSLKLNNKESELLKILISHKNQCVTFDQIFEYVWGFDKEHNEASLRTYIKNLRKYIGKERIKSIKKQGYIFV